MPAWINGTSQGYDSQSVEGRAGGCSWRDQHAEPAKRRHEIVEPCVKRLCVGTLCCGEGSGQRQRDSRDGRHDQVGPEPDGIREAEIGRYAGVDDNGTSAARSSPRNQ